jgi:hypothetical protein
VARAVAAFHSVLWDTQDFTSFDQDSDHMVSVIEFGLRIGASDYGNMTVEVRQPFGTGYDTEPFEVGLPFGAYEGPWNHADFAEACERYIRSLVGTSDSALRIAGATTLRMQNVRFFAPATAEFEILDAMLEVW